MTRRRSGTPPTRLGDDRPSTLSGGAFFLIESRETRSPRRSGAFETLALNGFADLDFSAGDGGRHRLRANDDKLAVAVAAGALVAEVVDDVVLVALPGTVSCWVLDCRREAFGLRPLCGGHDASCLAYAPSRRLLFFGSLLGDGALASVALVDDDDEASSRMGKASRAAKKAKVEGGDDDDVEMVVERDEGARADDAEWRRLYGAPPPADDDADAAAAPPRALRLTVTDSLVGVGAVLDATWSARTSHRWAFQPQRAADVKRIASEAVASRKAELVTCCGGLHGGRGGLATLGGGASVSSLCTFACDDAIAALFHFRWTGPFRGEDVSSSAASKKRDVVVAATDRAGKG